MSDFAIGIDLGTTYCSVGTFKGDKIDIIAFNDGLRSLPSHVYFNPKKYEIIVGNAAKYTPRSVGHAVYDSKRFIGSDYNDNNIQEDMKNWPFKVINSDGKPKVEIEFNNQKRQYSAEEISTFILKEIKKVADEYNDKDKNTKTKAVITVPAYFNHNERVNTKKAAEAANLDVIQIINEPTAAAIAYCYGRMLKNEQSRDRTILIYDFGGGTFDVSIIKLNESKKEVHVLATDGDAHLGGEDIDNLLVNHFIKLYKDKTGDSEKISDKKLVKLRKACEKAKELLSATDESFVACDFLMDAEVDCNIRRATFDKILEPLYAKTIKVVKTLLKEKEMNISEIDDILLVGGSSRIPKIQKILEKEFTGVKICKDINVSEVAAQGATIVANFKQFNFKVFDVVSHSLSTDIEDDKIHIMIKKNTATPCKENATFANQYDNQTYIDINVFEGEGKTIHDKGVKKLGSFNFSITSARALAVKITVTYDVDENGILKVTAKETISGETKQLKVTLK